MRPVVYIDVLFLVNFFINFLLLYTSAKIARLRVSHIRLPLAALLGAVYAVLMFFPRFAFVYCAAAKILSSLALVAIAYNIKGFRLFAKAVFTFFLVTLCFGGCTFALMCFTNFGASTGTVIKNGVIYINLPWQLLLCSVLASFIIINRVRKSFLSQVSDESYIDITVIYAGGSVKIRALLDTGNALYDPISSAPVIVAEFESVRSILPCEVVGIFENESENNLDSVGNAVSASPIACRIRLIPYCSVGKENGMLIGFKPDEVQAFINENIVSIADVIIGVCRGGLSKDSSFHALMHPQVISQ